MLGFDGRDGQYANMANISNVMTQGSEMFTMQPLNRANVRSPIESGNKPPSYSSSPGDAPPSYNTAARNSGGPAVAGRTPPDPRREANNNSNGVPLLTVSGARGSRVSSTEDLSDGRITSPPPPLHAQHLPSLDSQEMNSGFQEHAV